MQVPPSSTEAGWGSEPLSERDCGDQLRARLANPAVESSQTWTEGKDTSGGDGGEEGRRRRVRFVRRGRLRMVPAGERDDVWRMDRSRQRPNPERRLHVLSTIRERGGWLLAERRSSSASSALPSYVYCPPSTASVDDDDAQA